MWVSVWTESLRQQKMFVLLFGCVKLDYVKCFHFSISEESTLGAEKISVNQLAWKTKWEVEAQNDFAWAGKVNGLWKVSSRWRQSFPGNKNFLASRVFKPLVNKFPSSDLLVRVNICVKDNTFIRTLFCLPNVEEENLMGEAWDLFEGFDKRKRFID